MLLEDAETSLNKMPKAPLREDQDAFPPSFYQDAFPTFLKKVFLRILPPFDGMVSIRDLEIDSLLDSPGPSNDADWEGVMVIIQKVG